MMEGRSNSDNKEKFVCLRSQLNLKIVKKIIEQNYLFTKKWYLFLRQKDYKEQRVIEIFKLNMGKSRILLQLTRIFRN